MFAAIGIVSAGFALIAMGGGGILIYFLGYEPYGSLALFGYDSPVWIVPGIVLLIVGGFVGTVALDELER